MAQNTMKWEPVGDVMVCVHAETRPDQSEWDAFIAACVEMGSTGRMRGLLALANVELTPAQRSSAADVLKKNHTELAAVVTGSVITRGVVTAIGWFTGINKAYRPSDIERALRDLKLQDNKAADVRNACAQLARELRVDGLFFPQSSTHA